MSKKIKNKRKNKEKYISKKNKPAQEEVFFKKAFTSQVPIVVSTKFNNISNKNYKIQIRINLEEKEKISLIKKNNNITTSKLFRIFLEEFNSKEYQILKNKKIDILKKNKVKLKKKISDLESQIYFSYSSRRLDFKKLDMLTEEEEKINSLPKLRSRSKSLQAELSGIEKNIISLS